jgi:hypothetical protein
MEIKVLDKGVLIAAASVSAAEMNSSSSVSLDVISGNDRTITADAKNSSGFIIYHGEAVGVDMIGGTADVTLAMTSMVTDLNAAFNVRLFASDGVTPFTTGAAYLTSSITIEVYKPDYSSSPATLGSVIDSTALSVGTPQTTLANNLLAYPQTYQIAIANIKTTDGAFGLVGGVVISDLVSGDNTDGGTKFVDIALVCPAPISIDTTSIIATVNSWNLTVSINGTDYVIADSTGVAWSNPLVIRVPNSVYLFGANQPTIGTNRNVQLNIATSGGPVSISKNFDKSSSTTTLRWKLQTIP